MVLCGLWHGAGWTFVVWGALHGMALIACHMGIRLGIAPRIDSPLRTAVAWLLTFAFVVAAWVIFRATSLDGAIDMWTSMIGFGSTAAVAPDIPIAFGYEIAWVLVALALVWVLVAPTPYRWFFNTDLDDNQLNTRAIRLEPRAAIVFGLMFTVALLSLSRTTEFLYYNF